MYVYLDFLSAKAGDLLIAGVLIGATTFFFVISLHTVISRKVVEKNVHATIPKGNMGYVQYTVPDTVAVEPTFVSFL